MAPFVFIVGAQRSGTTWLQRLLASHPRIASGQESHLFSGYLAPLWQRWQEEHAYRAGGGRTVGLGCYLNEEEFVEELRGLARRVLGRVLEAKPGAALVVEKTPDHGLHLPLIHRLFPDAIILHLLRDGRDVVASMLHAKLSEWGRDWGPKSAAEAARRWMSYVRTIQHDMSLFARSRTLRFEELFAAPVEVMSDLFDFLGLPLPFEQVQAICSRWNFRAGESQVDSLVMLDATRQGTLEPPGFQREGQVGNGQESLALAAQATVIQEAGDLLRELGYDAELPARHDASGPERRCTSVQIELPWRTPRSLAIIDVTNAQLLFRDRLLLYSMVLAQAPERCLEIGACEGGASRIIHAALRDLGRGQLVAIDPRLQIAPQLSQQLADHVRFLDARSPQGLEEAMRQAGGPFDFVLLDGDHSERGVENDLLGLLEVTRPGSIVLAHDPCFTGVDAGIRSVIREGLPFADGGLVSTTTHAERLGDEEVILGGFRLLVRTQGNSRLPWRRLMRRVKRKLTSLVRRPRSR